MKKTILPLLSALALVCGTSSNAFAVITIDSAGVAGIMEGGIQGAGGTSVANEVIIANEILKLGNNQTVLATTPPNVECSDDQAPCQYRSGANGAMYSGTVVGGEQMDKSDPLDAGFTGYVLAKYDGQNAGYVLFYFPDAGSSVPQSAYTIWGANENQFGLSHYTVFGTFATPDGGSTAALLGTVLLGLGIVRRKLGRV